MGNTGRRRLLMVLMVAWAAGAESRAASVYSYHTIVEFISPLPVGPAATVGEAFGHLADGQGNGTIVLEAHDGAALSGFQLIDIADVGLFSNRPPTIPPDTGTFAYLVEVQVTSNGQTGTFDVRGTIDVTAANTALAQSTGSFNGVSPVSQSIGGTDFPVSLTAPGTGYFPPTIGANPLDGDIVIALSPAGAGPGPGAVPEPSTIALAGTAALIGVGSWWLRRRSRPTPPCRGRTCPRSDNE